MGKEAVKEGEAIIQHGFLAEGDEIRTRKAKRRYISVINQMLLLWYHAFKIHMELFPDKSLLL